MPKQPVLYEAMYIVDSSLDEAGLQAVVQQLEDFVTSNGGEVVATREFGRRRLAYEIEGHTNGTYMIFYFKSFGELVPELQHEMHLNEGIVRGIICVANPKALFEPKPQVAPEEAETADEAQAQLVAEIAGEVGPEAAAAEEAAAEEAPAEAPAAEEAPAEEVAAPAEETPEAVAEAPAADAEPPAAETEA